VRIALFAALAAALAGPASAVAATPATLPANATIARVPVAGLDEAGAKAKVQATLAPVWEKPITVRVGATDQQISTADLGFAIDYDGMVNQAFETASHHKPVHVKFKKTISSKTLSNAIAKLGKPFYKAPRDARVKFGVRKIVRIHGRYGHGIVPAKLRQKLKDELLFLVDEDTNAFNKVMDAFGLPKGSDEEKKARMAAIEEATKYAAEIPLKVMETAAKSYELLAEMAEKGNPASVSDVGVGALATRACIEGAGMNVRINLGQLKDKRFRSRLEKRVQKVRADSEAQFRKIIRTVQRKLG